MVDSDILEAEAKMLQQHKETADRVAKQNLDHYGLKSNRDEWDLFRMRQNDYAGRDGPRLRSD